MCLIAHYYGDVTPPSSSLSLFTFRCFRSPHPPLTRTPSVYSFFSLSLLPQFLPFPHFLSHFYSVIVGRDPGYWYDVMIHYSSDSFFHPSFSCGWDIFPYLLLSQTATSGGLVSVCQPWATTSLLKTGPSKTTTFLSQTHAALYTPNPPPLFFFLPSRQQRPCIKQRAVKKPDIR